MLCGSRAFGVRGKKRLRRSNAEGDRATFNLIANRLLRQFQEHNLQHAAELFTGFGQWVAFANSSSAQPLSPIEAAAVRCRKVAAGVQRIAEHCPPDLPYLAGWYIDTHVPLLQAGCSTVFETYQESLAPEQQGGFPVAVGPPFKPEESMKAALQAAWFPLEGAPSSMLSKLLTKGTRPPISIRYIGPQCIRTMTESAAGLAAMTAMMVAGALRAYPHSRATSVVWPLQDRAKVYAGATPEGVKAALEGKTARQLFSAVCEYAVALTSQHPSLWRAVSCSHGGLNHIRAVQHDATYRPKLRGSKGKPHAKPAAGPTLKSKCKKSAARCKIPSDVTRKCNPCRLRKALLAPTPQKAREAEPALTQKDALNLQLFVARHQAPLRFSPLSHGTAAIQREAVARATGVSKLPVAVCQTCTVLHRKVKGAPPPIKKRSGVSASVVLKPTENGKQQLSLTPGRCAACGTSGSVTIVDAVGLEIRARARHSDLEPITAMVCGSCGVLAAGTVDMLGAPRCRECAKLIQEAPWPRNVTRTCVCGAQAASPVVLVNVATTHGGAKLLPVCPKHAAVARHIPPGNAVPAKWLRNLFRARVQRSKAGNNGFRRRRLKQYISARRFSTQVKNAQ